MDLRDYFKILLILLFTSTISFSQETQVRCINPTFDKEVDGYLSYSVPTISVADAYESKQEYIFFDAREINEYDVSHIENAIHIGYYDFDIKYIDGNIPKDAQIIVYCSIGYRSEVIGEKLKKAGYQKVFNLYGSIFEWVNQHHPIFDIKGNQTQKLHTYNKKWSKWVEDQEIEKVW